MIKNTEMVKSAIENNKRAIDIIRKLSKIKGEDCVGGFYAIYEVDESLIEEAKQLLKDIKKEKSNGK